MARNQPGLYSLVFDGSFEYEKVSFISELRPSDNIRNFKCEIVCVYIMTMRKTTAQN